MLHEDGTLTVELDNYQTPSSSCYLPSGYWIDTGFSGYATLDNLYESCVQSALESYTYENNMSN